MSEQLVSELDITGGDDRKVGYYAGMIVSHLIIPCTPPPRANPWTQESLFFATEALCVLQWSRLSDYLGRKPVLLTGLFGSALSMLCFGLSRTFWTLVIR
jgi:MFS family permease